MNDLDLSRAVWRKSSRSSGNGQCVEVAHASSAVALRDSKNINAGVITVTSDGWRSLLGAFK
jgi:uncharacterized protein DUF397